MRHPAALPAGRAVIGSGRSNGDEGQMTVLFDGSLFADYHQVYLADARDEAVTSTDWTSESLTVRLLSNDRTLTFSTARNMTVPVRVQLYERQPDIDAEKADHVVIGSFRSSGQIVIAGLNDYWPTAPRASVPAGRLCVMVVSSGLGTLSADHLEGQDRYDVHLWPCDREGTTVLRQWTGGP